MRIGYFDGLLEDGIGDIGCVSLDAYKVIGNGEGGLALTDNEWMYTRAQGYHDAAACWRPDRFARGSKLGELFCCGNYSIPETCAAVWLAQARKLDWINECTRAAWKQIQAEARLP